MTEFEAVGDRLGHAGDADRRAMFDDGFDAFAVGFAPQARDAEHRVAWGGRLRRFWQCDSDFDGELGADLVELKGGQQAVDGLGDASADFDEPLMLALLVVRQAVEAAGGTLQPAVEGASNARWQPSR